MILVLVGDLLAGESVDLLVWGNPDEDVEVLVDGHDLGLLQAGTRAPIKGRLLRETTIEFRHLRSGGRVIRRVRPRSSSRLWVVPVRSDMCFAVAQLKPSWREDSFGWKPQIYRRIGREEVFDVAVREPYPVSRVVLTGKESWFRETDRVDVLDSIPCTLLHMPDEVLLARFPRIEATPQ